MAEVWSDAELIVGTLIQKDVKNPTVRSVFYSVGLVGHTMCRLIYKNVSNILFKYKQGIPWDCSPASTCKYVLLVWKLGIDLCNLLSEAWLSPSL